MPAGSCGVTYWAICAALSANACAGAAYCASVRLLPISASANRLDLVVQVEAARGQEVRRREAGMSSAGAA